jgi:ATP-dependent helicase/nuclease subunit A
MTAAHVPLEPAAGPLRAVAAYEHNGAPVDAARFYAIACDPRRSVVVEACAGAGKTWVLVSRIVRALLDGCAPHEILAITFTKKAAAEMRQRLQALLAEFATASDAQLVRELRARGLDVEPGAPQLQTLRGLHVALLQGGRPVQIRTFHSWFAALVGGAPLGVLHGLGLPTTYELLQEDKPAIAQVWRRFFQRVVGDPAAHADYRALVAAHGRHQAHKALEQALHKRTEFALADAQGVVAQSVAPHGQQFAEFAGFAQPYDALHSGALNELLWQAAKVLGAQTGKKSREAASGLEQALGVRDADAAMAALFTQKLEPRALPVKGSGAEVVTQAQDSLLRVRRAQIQHEAWLHQGRMARLLRLLVADYADLKRERGWIDMGDLELAALALMSDPVLSGWVQERLDAQVRHLLIDEFQDTNPLQWQALSAWISGYAGAGKAPGVFIVGDPKQSIYRFRRAEPQVFRAAKAFVQHGLGGELLSCDHTRRNAQAVVVVLNTVMQEAQNAGEFDGFRPHSTDSQERGRFLQLPQIPRPASARKAASSAEALTAAVQQAIVATPSALAASPAAAEPASWRDSLTTPRFVLEDTAKTLECRQAARWLAQQLKGRGAVASGGVSASPEALVQQGAAAWPEAALSPGDVMVLARKRESLGWMQAELAALGIAAQQPESADLCDMPEVQDLVALLDVLCSPRHDLSLARVLKSPLFGASDADLVQLALRHRSARAATRSGAATTETAVLASNSATRATPAPSWFDLLRSASDLPSSLAGVGATLAAWQRLLATLPAHDALHSIYESGDVLARYAAAAPAGSSAAVLANLRALLGAVLALDGARYTTPFALVRALRAGGIAAPVQARPGAVRLLTIHGAKGLEAPLVLLLDTDGENPNAETMGVLVDWPGESPHPQRFVFLTKESEAPDCAQQALSAERAARDREEINALYVAMTRAKHTLVISSLAPHRAQTRSPWQRLHTHAELVTTPAGHAPHDVADGVASQIADAPPVHLWVLPQRSAKPLPPLADFAAAPSADTEASRMGEAMHRLLEWVQPQPGGAALPPPWTPGQLAQLASQFGLNAEQVASACAMACGILAGEAAWAWDSAQIDWAANEVPIVHRGRALRIDRLVRRAPQGVWWVLDYKSQAQPHLSPELSAQLAAYRQAVAEGVAEASAVCAAFVTPQGRLIVLDAA